MASAQWSLVKSRLMSVYQELLQKEHEMKHRLQYYGADLTQQGKAWVAKGRNRLQQSAFLASVMDHMDLYMWGHVVHEKWQEMLQHLPLARRVELQVLHQDIVRLNKRVNDMAKKIDSQYTHLS